MRAHTALAVLMLISAGELRGQCATDIYQGLGTTHVSLINFVPSGAPSGVMIDAFLIWAQGCDGYAAAYPELMEHSSDILGGDTVNVHVTFHSGRSTQPNGKCAVTDVTIVDDQIASAEMQIWEQQGNGLDCSVDYAEVIAHEIGHVFGLAEETSAACANTIMGTNLGSPNASQCDEVSDNWTTGTEDNPDDPYCSAYCWTQCINAVCPDPPGGNCSSCSPVLIDLDDDGFHLVGIGDAVTFDVNADGSPDSTTWTRRGAQDAFLVLDRNANGRIDDGGELFGTSTQLSSGESAPNGYIALAEFDTLAAGGNADEQIDARDRVWNQLQVWTDWNHNGRSDPNEARSLAVAGVESIRFKYTRSNHTDEHGNVFRFKAKAIIRDKHGRAHAANTYDVFFVVTTSSPARTP